MHSHSGHHILIKRRRSAFDDEDSIDSSDYVPDSDLDMESHIQNQHAGNAPSIGERHRFHQSWRRHVQRLHGGKPKRGRHRHARFGKYQYVPGKGRAKGVDVHRDAWPLLEDGGDVVYVAAEGCLKADAILSQHAPVVSYGSVTLWEDSRWPWLAERYLSRFKRTVVVPDSDWSANSLVRMPTLKLADMLTEIGIQAVVAAPPQRDCSDCGHESRVTNTGEVLPPAEHKYGVDDWLADGHELAEMRVLPKTNNGDVAYREGRLLSVLNYYATDSGTLNASSQWLAEHSGLSPDQVDRLLHKLERGGIITLAPGAWSSSSSRRPPRRITVLDLKRGAVTLAEYLAQG